MFVLVKRHSKGKYFVVCFYFFDHIRLMSVHKCLSHFIREVQVADEIISELNEMRNDTTVSLDEVWFSPIF